MDSEDPSLKLLVFDPDTVKEDDGKLKEQIIRKIENVLCENLLTQHNKLIILLDIIIILYNYIRLLRIKLIFTILTLLNLFEDLWRMISLTLMKMFHTNGSRNKQKRCLRRRIAERLSNKFNVNRVATIGPDLACLEWLMECGATEVEMSDKQKIGSISQMKKYILETVDKSSDELQVRMSTGDLAYEEKWQNIPRTYIVKYIYIYIYIYILGGRNCFKSMHDRWCCLLVKSIEGITKSTLLFPTVCYSPAGFYSAIKTFYSKKCCPMASTHYVNIFLLENKVIILLAYLLGLLFNDRYDRGQVRSTC
uniref:Radical_SAM domain-containing protein n=1 Tax=Heterorhabditis bacteriophora TaxID=37862 RepID=A0A1I7X330_HETBA